MGGGVGLKPPPTSDDLDISSNWYLAMPQPPMFFPNEINKNTMLKEVQTWEIFLRKLGLPDKRDITMCSRHFLRYCHCLNYSNLMLGKCTRVCFL